MFDFERFACYVEDSEHKDIWHIAEIRRVRPDSKYVEILSNGISYAQVDTTLPNAEDIFVKRCQSLNLHFIIPNNPK